jgi:acyl-CoA thioesterase-1
MKMALPVALLALGCACGTREKRPVEAPKSQAQIIVGESPSDGRSAIVCFGDSITAGFGLDPSQSFPGLLQPDLDRRGLKYRVVNLGLSGATTQDGLGMIVRVAAERPVIVLLELGANDALRGVPLSVMQQNLTQMIEALHQLGARVVLAGMTLPPNYGQAYIAKFEAMYRDLAAKHKLTLIPFLMEGVGGHDELMQSDGLHPNAGGARKIESLVIKTLEPLLK